MGEVVSTIVQKNLPLKQEDQVCLLSHMLLVMLALKSLYAIWVHPLVLCLNMFMILLVLIL